MSDSATPPDNTGMPSGLELLRAWMEHQDENSPSIGRLLGMRPVKVDKGEVRFSVTPKPDFANPIGTVHGGINATMLDSVMGCAVHTALPPGATYSTLELKVNYIRTVKIDDPELTAIGTTIHVGRRTATAEGKVFSADGKLVAHGSTTCIVLS